MINPLISVIVPVYRVEEYLHRCIESILSQTYSNLEIILIDDGSPDSCGDICDYYEQKDSRIVVYHKKNGGLSDARNYGVKRANGEYISFIDSDDFVSQDYYEYLFGLIAKYDADISVCRMIETTSNKAEYTVNDERHGEKVFSGREACAHLFDNLYITLVTACGKLYSADIVRKYPFPIGKKYEDEATTCKYFYDSKKVIVGDRSLYAYYCNPESITHSQDANAYLQKIWALKHKAQFFSQCNDRQLEKRAWKFLLYYMITDSRDNQNRCDNMISTFIDGKKNLSYLTIFAIRIYSFSHDFIWLFLDLKKEVRKIVKKNK